MLSCANESDWTSGGSDTKGNEGDRGGSEEEG